MKKINHPDMVKQLAKDGQSIINELTRNSMHLLHMAVGVSGEAGELLEAVMFCKSFEEVDSKNILEELGDYEFYLEGLRQEMGIKREDTVLYCNEDFSNENKYTSLENLTIDIALLSMSSGMLLDEIKKMAIYVKPVNSNAVIKNLSKIEFCLQNIRNKFCYSYQDCLDHNIDKLGSRYKGHNYSNEQAQDRSDKK